MKRTIKFGFVLCAVALLGWACTPIEDQELRDKYVTNAGDPITVAELDKALEVSQPYPNQEGVEQGDQYIHLKNKRPEIGGTWHVGSKNYLTDDKIIVAEANGVYDVWYSAVSNGKIVNSTPVQVTVTNVFDPWMGLFTGAESKADMTATKEWGFRSDLSAVCDMCAHGWWKSTSAGYTPESFSGVTWWNNITFDAAGDQRMVFAVDGNKLTTFDAAGTQMNEGTFAFSHEQPEDLVQGLLTTTCPIIGSEFDDNGQGDNNRFYILTLTDKYMTLYQWESANPGEDWGDCSWRVVYEAK